MEKPKKELTAKDIGELHPLEIQLIYFLRNRWRYGDVVISMRDGRPYQVKRYVDIERFD